VATRRSIGGAHATAMGTGGEHVRVNPAVPVAAGKLVVTEKGLARWLTPTGKKVIGLHGTAGCLDRGGW